MSMPTLRRWIGGGVRANVVALALFVHLAILFALLLPHLSAPEPETVAVELMPSEGGATEMPAATDPVSSTVPAELPKAAISTPIPAPPEPAPPEPAPPEPVPAPVVAAPAPAIPPPPAPPPERPRRVYAAEANTIIRDDAASVTTTGDDTLPPQLAGFHNASPVYPPEAERRRQEGEVRLLIRINRDGIPAAVEVVTSSGIAVLDRAAVDTLQTWRFTPARAAAYTFSIRFVLGQR